MYRFLLTRRWLGVWAALLVLVPAFILLGRWQLDRFDQRVAANRLIETNLAAAPAPVEQLAPVGGSVSRTDQWRRVTASGHYDLAGQRLVRHRSNHGRPGFHVLVPLLTESGPAVLVDRGWIPVGERATDSPTPPAPPTGVVSVLGRLRLAQPGAITAAGMPPGQIAKINTSELSGALGHPLHAGYVELVAERPAPATASVLAEVPRLSTGPHLAYAVQWWLFAIGAVIGVGYLARREAADLRAAATDPAVPPQTGQTSQTGQAGLPVAGSAIVPPPRRPPSHR
ncbi:MAG: SURF1 family protein [Sporichthyaceae bacterium]|nr:SURF1 family protein [Sporichthyaceae bacterium]